MKTRSILALMALTPFALACSRGKEAAVLQAPPVALAEAIAVELEDRIEATGELVSPNHATVAAEVGGRITSLYVNDGAHAARGERVLEIDPQEAFATTWLALLTRLTGRTDGCMATAARIRTLSDDPFYLTASYLIQAWAHLGRGDVAAAAQSVAEGAAAGAMASNLRAFEAGIAVRQGRTEDARAAVAEARTTAGLGGGTLLVVAGAALRLGDLAGAIRFLAERKVIVDLAPICIRLEPELHALADHAPFAPRRLDMALVWPLEAPMIDPRCFPLFREVRIESGLPPRSEMLGPRPGGS